VKVPATPDETFNQTLKGFGTLVERITPWLLDLGSWIFGALIAFDLLILAALLTVGPADLAALVATAAFALALPPNAAGFFLLKVLEDIKNARLEDVAVQAFQEAGFGVSPIQAPDAAESVVKQRTKTVLIYSYSILSVSVLLTVIGVTAHGLVDQRRLRRGDAGQSGRGSGSDGQLAVSRQTAVKSVRKLVGERERLGRPNLW
jgi:hypothetical protein